MFKRALQSDVVICNSFDLVRGVKGHGTCFLVGLSYKLTEAPIINIRARGATAINICRLCIQYGMKVIAHPPLARELYARGDYSEILPTRFIQRIINTHYIATFYENRCSGSHQIKKQSLHNSSFNNDPNGNGRPWNDRHIDDGPLENEWIYFPERGYSHDYCVAMEVVYKREREIMRTHYNAHGEQCINPYGYSKRIINYFGTDFISEVLYFAPHDLPILCRAGYHRMRYERDNDGNATKTTIYGIDNRPCLNNEGYSECRMEYNEFGECLRWEYFDANQKPCMIRLGYSKCIKTYDYKKNIVTSTYFDAEDHRCFHINGTMGWIALCDDHGRMIKRTCLT